MSMTKEEYYKKLEEAYPKKYKVRKISTDCSTFDEMLGGGIPRGKVSALYGTTNTGKSVALFQIAANFCRENPDLQVLYVDAEAFWDTEEIEIFQEIYKKRWGMPKDYAFPIMFVKKYDLYTLYDYFGMTATVNKETAKTTVDVKFRRDILEEKKTKDKLGRERKKIFKRGEHAHILESNVYKYIRKNNIGMVIVDSATQCLKEIFQTSKQQDYPARANLINPFLGTLRSLAIIEDMPVVCALHLTYDMKGQGFKYRTEKSSLPWGGADVVFHIKVIIGILNVTKADSGPYKSVVGEDNLDQLRWIYRYRVPGRMQEIEIVHLKKDYGYTDVKKLSGREGTG